MKKIRCAVVGIGYLGKFHAEKYAQLPQCELVAVCDIDRQRGEEIANQYKITFTNDYHDLIGQVDAISIAAPTLLHYKLAKLFLENDIHVLVEKPITTTVAEAEELIKLAEEKKLVLQVGHLERFNTAIKAVHSYLDHPLFIESVRLAPFKLRGADVNVVLDLMIHDIDLIQDIVKVPIKSIQAHGACILSQALDIASARIVFENGCVANVTASRVSLQQERKLRIFQPHSYISLDLSDKKLAFHQKGANEMFPGIPEIVTEEFAYEQGDALKEEINAFANAIIHQQKPVVTGEDGKQALATAIEITNLVHQQMQLQNQFLSTKATTD